MIKENLVALLHALSGAGALIVGLMTRDGFDGPAASLKTLGFGIFILGMLLFSYAVLFLKEAFRGNVRPVTETVIREGPYRVVRHPLYLGMTISTAGLSIGMRSLWGLAATFTVFLPLTVLRAKLEERALHQKFGAVWEEYTEETHFLFPPIW